MIGFKSLLTRTLSGVVYTGIIIACAFWGYYALIAMAAAFGIVSTVEFFKITHPNNTIAQRTATLLVDLCGVLALSMGTLIYPLFIWVAIMLIRLVMELFVNDPHPMRSLGVSAFTQLYIGLPLLCMTGISFLDNNTMPVLAIFLMIWGNDTGAFLVGSMCGKHKMWPRLSPKKTWEGFAGGLLASIGIAALIAYCFPQFFGLAHPAWVWLGMGAIVTIFSTWGDLFESMIKRSFNLKDSGNLIPGHGGILDRIDSMLFVMPAAFIYLFCYEFLVVFLG